MTDIKSPDAPEVPESLWTLIKQLRLRDLINAIKQIVADDMEHLCKIARGRELNIETVKILFLEAIKTRTAHATLITVAVIVSVILIVYPMCVGSPFLDSLGFTSAGPAAASPAATWQSVFGVSALFSTLQSAAMGGYGVPVVAGIVSGVTIAVIVFAGFMWSRGKCKTT